MAFISVTAEAGRVKVGSGLQLQKWQLGAHCPPDASDGHSSLHAESPQIAASPLTSKVSKARNSTRTARGTAPGISQDARRVFREHVREARDIDWFLQDGHLQTLEVDADNSLAFCGHDDDGKRAPARVTAQPPDQLDPVHHWHQKVGDDQRRRLPAEGLESIDPMLCHDAVVASSSSSSAIAFRMSASSSTTSTGPAPPDLGAPSRAVMTTV